jgi:hypothetical protein
MLAPWLLVRGPPAPGPGERLRRGAATLAGLCCVVVALQAARGAPRWSPLGESALVGIGLALTALMAWIAPSVVRSTARVRSPGFQESLATLRLPRWYVVPAAVTGGVAADAAARAAAFIGAETRSGAAWQAAGIAVFLDAVLHVPRWSLAMVLAAAATAAGIVALLAWHRAACADPAPAPATAGAR